MRAKLIQANSIRIPLANESVQCVVTSPPYYGLRDYGTAEWVGGDAECDHRHQLGGESKASAKQNTSTGTQTIQYKDVCMKCGATRVDAQLGLEPTLAEYIENMCLVFDELWRVLRPDGTVWLNMGDSYQSSNAGQVQQTKDAVLKTTKRTGMEKRPPMQPGLKPKDLMGVPWRLAFALQERGASDVSAMHTIARVRSELFSVYDDAIPDKVIQVLERLDQEYAEAKGNSWWLRSDIIWHKPNPMPESVTDRPTKSHEYIFLLSKSKTYFYDADAIREPASPDKSIRDRDNTKLNNTPGRTKMGGLKTNNYPTRNKRTVWTVTTKPYSGAHFATFPPDLIEPCILAGTSEKGQCPECGAPWERVVEKEPTGEYQKAADGWDTGSGSHGTVHREGREKGKGGAPVMQNVTTGWRPTCEHDLDPVPQIILDPFGGSGTTAQVSQAHGRIGVCLDLSWKYLQLARERCGLKQMSEWQNGKKHTETNIDDLPLFQNLDEGNNKLT